MNLTTIARIRVLCGFRPGRVTGRRLGTGDGVRRVFSPTDGGLFISPFEDTPQLHEIVVRVNSNVVNILGITETEFTLQQAPLNNHVVEADFWTHRVSNQEIDTARTAAEAQIVGKLIDLYSLDSLAMAPVVAKVVSYTAAAEIVDAAYNEAGSNTTHGTLFPATRLRKVAEDLMADLMEGHLVLVDYDLNRIPMAVAIENWIAISSYPSTRDRLFENDPFDASGGVLVRDDDWQDFSWRDA